LHRIGRISRPTDELVVNYKLDQEEQEIIEAFDSGRLQSASDKESEIERHKMYASSTFKEDKRVNICISTKDFDAIQKIAIAEGMPYQILISSILHKYVEGRYIEKTA
jgi:predicted DNA binding CopG/RHH family protein